VFRVGVHDLGPELAARSVSFFPVTGTQQKTGVDWRRSTEAKNGAKAADVKTNAAGVGTS
jgi:hypothetical protein